MHLPVVAQAGENNAAKAPGKQTKGVAKKELP
jgi:hypothetical protein